MNSVQRSKRILMFLSIVTITILLSFVFSTSVTYARNDSPLPQEAISFIGFRGSHDFNFPDGRFAYSITWDWMNDRTTVTGSQDADTWTFDHKIWTGEGRTTVWCTAAEQPCHTGSGKDVLPTDKFVSLAGDFPKEIDTLTGYHTLLNSPIPGLAYNKYPVWVRVTNLDITPNQTADFRLVDAGPGLRTGNPIDMTEAAIKSIGGDGKEHTHVRFQILGGPLAPPPAQTQLQGSQQLVKGFSKSFNTENAVCETMTYDIDWNGTPISLSSSQDKLTPFAIDDELRLKVTHDDGSVSGPVRIISLTNDVPPQLVNDLFKPGKNHIEVQVYNVTAPDCGGGDVWLVWSGGLTPPDVTLRRVMDVGIEKPQTGTKWRGLRFLIDSWMKSIVLVFHKSSDANITLIGPDGTVYDKSNPNLKYIDTPNYAVLSLDNVQPGIWEMTVDVIKASPESVFYFAVGGRQGDIPSQDTMPPLSFIRLDGTLGLNNWYKSDVLVNLFGEDIEPGSGIRDIQYNFDNGNAQLVYNAPFIHGQEGISTLTSQATDKAGNSEFLPAIKQIKIDKTAPVVHTWTDQTEYTRVQPFVVHFNGYDPMPGSGLWTLTGQFNGQAVQDGQVVDLFWLDLGTYTLATTGKDYAGWVTVNSASFKMIATIESLQATVDRLCLQGYITNKGICTSLQQKLDAALKARNKGQIQAALGVLNAFQAEVKAQTGPEPGKHIRSEAARILFMDSSYIIQALGPK